jgi:hypothetical protein
MKCIKSTKSNTNYKPGSIFRVENKEADLKVSTGAWVFVPKSEWKQEVRGTHTTSSTEGETKKKKKTNKQD